MKKLLLFLAVAVFVSMFLISCGKSSTSPQNSTSTPTLALNLTGTWSGSVADSSGAGVPGPCTWQIVQSGDSISGTFLARAGSGGSIVINGTVSGTISGTTLNFTMAVPVGGIQSPIYATCTINLSGSAALTNTTINGTYKGNNSCSGPFTNGQLALTK